MIEVKFRAWDKKKSEYWTDMLCDMAECDVYDDTLSMWDVAYMMKTGDNSRFDFEQHTGLKDKNGKEIYEGDIVVCGVVEDFKGVVEYNPYSCLYFVNKAPLQYFVRNDNNLQNLEVDIKVIGNIHENPELLEGEHEGQ